MAWSLWESDLKQPCPLAGARDLGAAYLGHSGFQDVAGLTLTNLRLWLGTLREKVKWMGWRYQRARVEALGTSQAVELMETAGKTSLGIRLS